MKEWFFSKTLWFNAISISLGLIDVLLGQNFIDPSMHLMLNSTGNFLLRFFTTQPLTK